MAKQTAAVFGAGEKAVCVKRSLTSADILVQYFIVQDKEGVPTEIDGLPVISAEEFFNFRKAGMLTIVNASEPGKSSDPVVYIALDEKDQAAAASIMREHDYNEYMKVEADSFGKMMKRYYDALHVYPSVKDIPSDEELSRDVFLAQTVNEIEGSPSVRFNPGPFAHVIQTGTAVSKTKFGSENGGNEEKLIFYDNAGENISFLNKSYGLLTALYWMWKNTDAKVIGLSQKRRMLDIKKHELYLLLKGELDIILPYPMISLPSCDAHRSGELLREDWEGVKQALFELHPEGKDIFEKVLSNQYVYSESLFIGRREIVNDYCAWLFPVLTQAKKYIPAKSATETYRYNEFAGEILFTCYFISNLTEARKAHTTVLVRP